MVTTTYPGVYVQEISSGVRTITGVSTSVAAFIDFFPRGPMNKAVQILSMSDFTREFGGLHEDSEASYAISQFFLNGGTSCWIVRVADGANAAAINIAGEIIADPVNPPDAAAVIEAANEGVWGDDLVVRFDDNVGDGEFNLSVGLYPDGASSPTSSEVFRNLTTESVEDVLADPFGGSSLIRMGKPTGDLLINGTRGATIDPTIELDEDTDYELAVKVNNEDPIALGFQLKETDSPISIPVVAEKLQDVIRSKASESAALASVIVTPVYHAGTTSADDRYHLLITSPNAAPETIIGFKGIDSDDTFGLGSDATANCQAYYVAAAAIENTGQLGGIGGEDGDVPGASALQGKITDKSGLYALEDVDLFNLLCLPGIAEFDDDQQFKAVAEEAMAYCESRRAFLLVDPPNERIHTPADVRGWLSSMTLRSEHAALFYPRVQIPDELNDYRLRSFGPSGTIAGLMARVDSDRGVWKAAAGTDFPLRNVSDFDYVLTDAENGVLNPLAINCLRSFPVYGRVCWGARTIDGADQLASEWKYIPVRRLALYIEESLFRGTKWAVFEPNDEPLWSQLRLNIGAFMNTLFRKGAFQGSTPSEAYFVKCDSTTTTQNDINNGIVNIIVGFAPLKPAEFVVISIQQIAGDIQT